MELQQLLERLSVEVAELSVPSSVPIEIPPIQDQRFYRKYICSNTPCLLEGMAKGWHAIGKWDRDYLSAKCQDKMITVDITPNGRGDAVVFDNLMQKELFVTPYSEKMTLCQFFQMRERTQILKESIVPYVQHQNGNLLSEFPMLTDDVPKSLEFADRLFDQKPDAVNLWIGDQRSATSFHKDHYENFYAVLRGTKLFTVLPPCSVWRMHLNTYDSAQYHMENNQLCIKMNEPNIGVRWCPIDLEQRNGKQTYQLEIDFLCMNNCIKIAMCFMVIVLFVMQDSIKQQKR
eukprot:TRINITY_DN7709_c0_g1_i1.p2 TRINITY_DN7709_c0_g1~~TRINITY_DN7709_c0_g1_i1.p2  ORF type:complete len:289 (+),score=12.50 TRINITY_DN7709_c0_g1_i1:201-1067(+)